MFNNGFSPLVTVFHGRVNGKLSERAKAKEFAELNENEIELDRKKVR
ncbi:MAG: hypothetical protein WKG06_32805 [Segetibacter sp.]